MRFYLARCLECVADEVPFYDPHTRQEWSVAHTLATGHAVHVRTVFRVHARARLTTRFLAIRRTGAGMRHAVVGLLTMGGECCGVALDFRVVEAITPGFADEFLAVLVDELGGAAHADRPRVCLLGVNPDVEYALRLALGRRGLEMPPEADPTQLLGSNGDRPLDVELRS